jgi:hypothetical protein
VSKQQRPALANRRTAAPGRSSAWETPGADSTTIPRDRVDTATGTTFRGRPNLNTLLGHSASAWKEGSMDLHIGQRIVCVDVNFSRLPSPQRNLPLRDIRRINELVGLCLHEIVNASADFAEGYVEAAFDTRRFRPVRATNVEMFKALLITDRITDRTTGRVGARRQRELV